MNKPNKLGTIEVEGMGFDVVILDEKKHAGRELVLVTPVAGYGEKWKYKVNVEEYDETEIRHC